MSTTNEIKAQLETITAAIQLAEKSGRATAEAEVANLLKLRAETVAKGQKAFLAQVASMLR